MYKYFLTYKREYIFIILTATIFSFTFFSKCLANENVFVIDNVKVSGVIDKNFSRDKYINKAFLNSFDMLMSKILLSEDLNKLSSIKLDQIKSLINVFQVVDESYQQNIYKAVFKIFYNDKKVKNLLVDKNISFSEPKNIPAVFFPAFFINDELLNLNENFFYNEWNNIKIKSELINFILPIEDYDEILKIKKMKNTIDEFNFEEIVNKYNTKNYIFALIDYDNNKLNIYLKTNFNNNEISKNINYKLVDINDKEKLNFILKDLKVRITDIWKSENIINLATSLSIKIKFKYSQPKDLNDFKNTLYKINIIDKYRLDEFNINNSLFKIDYYGNPKKLSNELLKYNYLLKEDQGKWEIYKNE